MFEQTGIQDRQKVIEKFPSMERINKGPVAVAECYAAIPCNPCETACKFGAIAVGEDINNIPRVDFENCVGCGVCISKCPGLAIMVIDGSKSDKYIYMKLPYEFLPLPQKGSVVSGLDRSGAYVCDCVVADTAIVKAFDRTPIVTLEVPREHLYDVRNFRLGGK